MPLPTGTWSANVNGQRGSLVVTSVDAAGVVAGTINLSAPVGALGISGIWDEITQKLTFGPPPTIGLGFVFTAFLFRDQFRVPGIVGGSVFTLAGSFTGEISGAAINPDQPVFGWYAQIGLP
jgi:hypothetical protein